MEEMNSGRIETAILAGLNADTMSKTESSCEESMDELEALLETAGGVCAARLLQNRASPDPKTFIGSGKAIEIAELAKDNSATLLVLDNELSPSQARGLEEACGVRVMDRSGLILDIFAQRANTREGRLQVELAQYKYLLPRLSGMWGHLVRQTASGGKSPIGTRGPGETQLETDRRHIRRKITKLEEELAQVRKVRGIQRERRLKNDVPTVALVGYTNAGKSTLMNALTNADIPANDRLFDTLDTTTRRMRISDTLEVLLSDTVGFIRRLPHQLVEAFKATLEELTYADLLIHVIDVSNAEWELQAETVENLIIELGAASTPMIRVYNKSDLTPATVPPAGKDAIIISALSGDGLDELKTAISRELDLGASRLKLSLPYDKAGLLDMLYREAKVEGVEYLPESIEVTAVCNPKQWRELRQYSSEA